MPLSKRDFQIRLTRLQVSPPRVPAIPGRTFHPCAGHGTHGTRSTDMKSAFTRFIEDESGATAIEYGLLAALISVVIIGAVKVAGTNLSNKFTQIANNLS